MSVDDVVAAMTRVVSRHMQEHPELEATPEAVTAIQSLIRAAAQRLTGDPVVADPRVVSVDSAQALMDTVSDMAQDVDVASAGPAGSGARQRRVTEAVVSASVQRRCPLWPFCFPEPR